MMLQSTPSRHGISFQLSALTCLLIVIGFSILSMGYFYYSKYKIQQRIVVDAKNSLELASASLSQAVWVFDQLAINHIGQSLIEHSQGSIVALRVYTMTGKKLAEEIENKSKGLSFEKLTSFSYHTFFESSLKYHEQEIGKVQIIYSSAILNANLYDLFLKMLFLTGFTTALFSILVFVITHRILDSPIQRLIDVAEKIREGDYSIQEEGWKHEFRILSRAFVAAAKEIQKRDLELKLHAERLELQVAQRTKELDAQRMKMVNSSHLASLGEISAGIAHEINNPLAIIQGKTELLQKLVADNPTCQSHLEKIIQMVTRISKIVKGLRAFARDGGKDPMLEIRVKPFLEEVASLCQARIRNQDIEFTIDSPPDLEVYGREVQISQVLINLINNSIDAIENLSSKWIRLEVFERGSDLVFAVIDSGSGISEGIRSKVMEPFFTTKTIGKGTGLGLSISIGIIREHGGDLVYVDQCPNTRFEVLLPNVKIGRAAA